MKKLIFTLLTLVLAIGLSIPMATPAMAATGTVTVNSDTTVQIVGVYNEAGGVSTFVDLSGSPLNAVRAQEPKPYPNGYVSEGPEVANSIWDTNVNWSFQTNAPLADWIWEIERAEWPATVYAVGHPLYDADASKWGRVVVFQKTFAINGTPTEGSVINITADNCYEVRINGQFLARSATAKVAGWETSDLHEASVATNGWQTVGHHTIPAVMLQNGVNTLVVLAGDEYYDSNDGNSSVPAYVAVPYRQMNPGAVIFSLTAIYEEVANADLDVTKSVNNATPVEGSNVVWTITVTNNGPSNATGVQVADVLPAGVTYVSDDGGAGAYSAGVWTIGNLAPGASATLHITTSVNLGTAGSTITNTAVVSATTPDSNTANNTASASTNPVANADLDVTKSVNNATPVEGSNVVWTITVTNNGPSNATGVQVADVLPAGVTYVSDDGGAGAYSAGVWTIGNLAPGASATLHITTSVNLGTAGSTITNTAVVSATTPDSNTANNTASASTNPVANTGVLLPTDTSVQMYASGEWPEIYDSFYYGMKGGKINNVSPGVIFYYNTIKAPSADFTLEVIQMNSSGWNPMLVQQNDKKMQAYLYNANFNIVNVAKIQSGSPTYTVQFYVTGATPGATYYIGIKYSPANLKNLPIPTNGQTSTEYFFETRINGSFQAGSGDSITVLPK
jgi:uncharacterized repeat protein (TIGR01451 family)